MFKKLFLYALAFTVSLSGLSVLLPVSSAKAASIYDNVLEEVDQPFRLGNNDRTLPWVGEFLATYSFDSTCQTYADDLVQRITTANSGKYNISYMNYASYPNTQTLHFSYSSSPTTITDYWSSTNLQQQGYDKRLSVDFDGNNIYVTCGSADTYELVANSYTTFQWFRILETNHEIVYPPDYAGVIIGPTIAGTNYAPEIGYHLDDSNTLRALTLNVNVCLPVGLEIETGCIEPKLRWQIFEEDGTTEIHNSVTNLVYPFEFHFPSIDEYVFMVSYVPPGPPALPVAPGVNLTPTRFIINANSTFYVGGTGVQDCAVVSGINECGLANPLEDCSVFDTVITIFDTDIPLMSAESLACQFRNFGIWFRNTLIDLFVPSTRKIQRSFDEFQVSLQSQFGFLYTGFEMMIQWLQSLLLVTPNCHVNLGGTFFSAPISFNFCYFEDAAPTIWNIMMPTVRLILAAGFVFVAYRRLLEIVRGLGS